jgi:two-component system sensor histidine kinase KdpD
MREVSGTGEIWRDPLSKIIIVPVRLGGPCLGSLAVTGSDRIAELALQAIAQLVAIALERAKAHEIAARVEATRQNEQLKSTLLDALAHEFKTPLTSIKAAATSLLSRSKLEETQRDLLVVVDEETDRLNNLVNEAIELARVGAGPVTLHRQLCFTDELISSAAAQCRELRDERDLDIKVDPDLPALQVDRRLAELALRQLLSNAFKYSPASSLVQIKAEGKGESIMISVSNVGAGIPKAEQNLIFEKFYRGRDVRASVPGTGMGLAIAREIIEAHGGRLEVRSESGEGARFWLTLPISASSSHLQHELGVIVA